jgi:hypothetical protein
MENPSPFLPLSPKHVYKDQLKMKRESDVEMSENTYFTVSHEVREKLDSTERKTN